MFSELALQIGATADPGLAPEWASLFDQAAKNVQVLPDKDVSCICDFI